MKHANVAVFVPHAGCPHQCSFCNQRHISGEQESPGLEKVREILTQALQTLPEAVKPAQIAFFGGSFTAIPREYMLSLLETAYEFIDNKIFYGIRISTRPDAIDGEILDILKKYKVIDIELGVQSMDNGVLTANLRGHTAEDTVKAASLIKSRGLGLGLQMMTGLHTANTEITFNTAKQLAQLKPECVRIYPTMVLRDTRLEELYKSGEYKPQKLDSSVDEAARLLKYFTGQGIPVIRLGLHDSPNLNGNIVAGPHHPAFRELCESRLMLWEVLSRIEINAIPKGKITIFVRPGSISKMTGQRRENLEKLKQSGYDAKIVADDKLGLYEAEIRKRM